MLNAGVNSYQDMNQTRVLSRWWIHIKIGYYYVGGTIETIFDVDFKTLNIEWFKNFATQEFGDGRIKNDRYKLLGNDKTNNEVIKDARRVGYVDDFMDQCGEKKLVSVTVGDDMDIKEERMHDDESDSGHDTKTTAQH